MDLGWATAGAADVITAPVISAPVSRARQERMLAEVRVLVGRALWRKRSVIRRSLSAFGQTVSGPYSRLSLRMMPRELLELLFLKADLPVRRLTNKFVKVAVKVRVVVPHAFRGSLKRLEAWPGIEPGCADLQSAT